MAKPQLQVIIVSPEGIVFQGAAGSISFPGAQGEFEVLPLHRPLVSRLAAGRIRVDGRPMPVSRGIMRVADDVVTAVVELPRGVR